MTVNVTASGFTANQKPMRSVVLLPAKWLRLLRFCLVGTSGVFVNSTVLYLLSGVGGLNPLLAACFATEVAIGTNFLLNDRWTFRNSGSGAIWWRRLVQYNSVCLGGLLITVLVLALLTHGFGVHYLIANLLAVGVATGWNFCANSYFTWSTRTPAADIGRPDYSVLPEPSNQAHIVAASEAV